jgi:hypothetical protein
MLYFAFGVIALVVGLQLMRRFQNANPAQMARLVRLVGGYALLGLAVFLMLRGGIVDAVPLAGLGAWLVWGDRVPPALRGRWGNLGSGWGGAGGKSQAGGPDPATSRVVTDHLDVSLDHATGSIDGRVLKGLFQGRRIASLKPMELALLWQDCRFTDPQSARIVEVYLDHLHPTWREDLARGEKEMAGADGRVSPAEALQILGLEEGTSADDIRRAHRSLILKLHPDRGGSTYLAAKINEAKDVLLDQLGQR